MSTAKVKKTKTEINKTDSLWRKPIVLTDETDVDPLATLYRGRELVEKNVEKTTHLQHENNNPPRPKTKSDKSSVEKETKVKTNSPVVTENKTLEVLPEIETSNKQSNPKISEAELKAILRIKSETFIFTDIREILRGKSLEIYAYLRHLSKDAGVCKIKHLDLMRILDISRPTLFKQGDWLSKLSLIEKRNVPGDHFGTSYVVHRLEDVLPVSETLVRQLQSEIDSFT